MMHSLIKEASCPPGVVHVVMGGTVGETLFIHVGINEVAFTGPMLVGVGHKVMEVLQLAGAAESSLKNITLDVDG